MESVDNDDLNSPPLSTSTSSSTVGTLFTSASEISSSSGESSGGSGDIPTEVLMADTTAVEVRGRCIGRQERVSWGSTSIIGRRKEMEDAIAVVSGFMSSSCCDVGGCSYVCSRSSGFVSPVHFFGVYDGHGSAQVADFCATRMHGIIAEEWNREDHDGEDWQKKWEETFCSGFRRVDDLVITEAGASEMVGSTAVGAVVSGCQIIVSNCGDSRAILCKRAQTVPLTVDHKPDRPDELARIEGAGGRVINWMGARVSGFLAMSRAIGDRHLSPFVIPVPEITFTTRTDEDECLILASDGLWDVMSNDEAGDIARRLLRRMHRSMVAGDESPAQVVADHLREFAMGRNSSDNISVIVVDLKSRRRHNATQ